MTNRVSTFARSLAQIRSVHLLVVGVSICLAGSGESQQFDSTGSHQKQFVSQNFTLNTDLEPEQAHSLLARMESALEFAGRYWNRPHRGKITCYVARDLSKWPNESLPHPLARVLIGGLGGATLSDKQGLERSVRSQAVIYSSAQPGAAEHEVVHAYCAQNFGRTGPEWYKEGMAEIAAFGETNRSGVQCPKERLAEMRTPTPRQIRRVLQLPDATQKLYDSLDAIKTTRRNKMDSGYLDRWCKENLAHVQEARKDYVWCWSLCHFLYNNPNYSERFRSLGAELLTKRDASFEQHFGTMTSEIVFEYEFFVKHVDVGFRVDLCAWDWRKRFRTLDEVGQPTGRYHAARGWQPTGLSVTQGVSYAYLADGKWRTKVGGAETDANGGVDGAGRLWGVILSDFNLSEPIALGRDGILVAPTTGWLYLRCFDAWNKIDDNDGNVTVRFGAPGKL